MAADVRRLPHAYERLCSRRTAPLFTGTTNGRGDKDVRPYTAAVHVLAVTTVTAGGMGATISLRDLPKGGPMEPVPSQVVVGVDGSAASDAAVRWATQEATIRRLSLKLLHVVAPSVLDSTMAPDGTWTQRQEDQARQIIEQAQRIVDEQTGDKAPSVQAQVGLTPDGGHLTGGTAGPAGKDVRMSGGVVGTPRSFGSRLPAW